jgi:AcrR family transcriptional regulator
MTRRYQMGRRADAADETRQRIVRATYELHAERGIGSTSVRDIAERADVSPGTVYHHFPDYNDVIVACGKFTFETTRPPTRDIFDGIDTPGERLRVFVEEVFAFYRRFPAYEKVRLERDTFDPVEHAIAQDERNRRALIRAALAPKRPGRRSIAVAFALVDISVYHRLIRSGISHAAAVEEIHHLLQRRLLED